VAIANTLLADGGVAIKLKTARKIANSAILRAALFLRD
jgi:hypothetical protein